MVKISVVIITYNRANYLTAAIDSVICQSLSDWELLIIDDGSEDDTETVVSSYLKRDARIKYIKNSNNIGISSSRNKALEIAAGKYMAILDSDDIWVDVLKLDKQYRFLEANNSCVVVGGGVIVADENTNEIYRHINRISDSSIRKIILLRNPFLNSSVMFRRNTAIASGGYKKFTVGEDYDLFLRMGLHGELANLSDYLVKYRKHQLGVTWSKRFKAARDHLTIIRKYRGKYPNYYPAIIKGYLRLILALIMSCI